MLATFLFALAQAPALDSPFSAPMFEGAQVSVCVRDIQGAILFERNSGIRLIPASNQKLFTCAFALHTLGTAFRPVTRVWKLAHRTVVDSAGDPLMTIGRLREAANKLSLDPTLPVFVKQTYAPLWPETWELDDLPNKYAAPISAFTVDRGSFELWADQGRPRLEPDAYGTKIRWTPKPQEAVFRYDPFKREVTIEGTLPKERKRLDTLSLPHPDEAAASILGHGFYPTQTVPSFAPSAILEGNTIGDTMAACLQPSDNNVAEHLLLMATESFGTLADKPYPQARTRLGTFLTRVVGLSSSDFNVSDGSGMSRHNLATTRGLSQLLVWANSQPTGTLWRSSLAKPGIGTLGGRLAGMSFVGKTGSLDLVVGLSGYVKVKSGKDVVVSVLLNHYNGTMKDARDAADGFIKIVSDTL